MQVSWREQAQNDLERLDDYLSEHNPNAARRIYDSIVGRVAVLADYPDLGRVGRIPGTRELVIARTPYIVLYRLDRRADAVQVLRVFHGARRWPNEL